MPENEKDQGDEKLLILPLGEESKKITQVISNDTARQIIELLADAPLSANDIAQRLQAPLTTITYNLENLESVGLIKVEKIKYSEKGREVKIFAPVRKLIILVPEKTDRNSVADILRKYLGIILTALFASSLIELFMRNGGMKENVIQTTSNLYSLPPPTTSELPAITTIPVSIVNETIKSKEIASAVSSINATVIPPMATGEVQTIPAVTSTPIAPAPTSAGAWANATATPVPVSPSALNSGAANQPAPDIFTNLANTITAHPGLVFFLGCLFVIAMLIIMDSFRKKKNG
ncbi:MAG: helix-turn-helix domain-containing protein [Candidatus Methanoperedens sp.]|nr:helix-turn-helix domain-containing protein [Candidatus Methanoperedens sp.]